MKWPKNEILLDGVQFNSISPFILSASRSTDIPAFYAKELFNCLSKGFLFTTNPFNGKKTHVNLKLIKFIVFWTKNPAPVIPWLDKLDKLNIGYYFNYTLNNYENEKLEEHLPSLKERIRIFKTLAEKIGKEKLIWRFDPLILPEGREMNHLLERIRYIADELNQYTEKLVVSFVDLTYRKVQQHLARQKIQVKNLHPGEKIQFIEQLVDLLRYSGLKIHSCASEIDFTENKVFPNKCIDDGLIQKISPDDRELNLFIQNLREKNQLKDKNQREHCLCMISKDIGAYNSCQYSCTYCYAGHLQKNSRETRIFR